MRFSDPFDNLEYAILRLAILVLLVIAILKLLKVEFGGL
jgi:hypothetical protein